MQQLLQQGAACNVHYLFSMDTDQLTGPQVPQKIPAEKLPTWRKNTQRKRYYTVEETLQFAVIVPGDVKSNPKLSLSLT